MPSAFDCYLALRGIKTLHLRMRAHMDNALATAHWLEKHPKVGKVLYPELESHPQHAVHKKQTSGMSGMLSFYLRGGREQSLKFLKALEVIPEPWSAWFSDSSLKCQLEQASRLRGVVPVLFKPEKKPNLVN